MFANFYLGASFYIWLKILDLEFVEIVENFRFKILFLKFNFYILDASYLKK